MKKEGRLLRSLEYKGHQVFITVLADQGRWGYRVDAADPRMSSENRGNVSEEVLYKEAAAAAMLEIDRGEVFESRRAKPGTPG